jgi:hypothetical protein
VQVEMVQVASRLITQTEIAELQVATRHSQFLKLLMVSMVLGERRLLVLEEVFVVISFLVIHYQEFQVLMVLKQMAELLAR